MRLPNYVLYTPHGCVRHVYKRMPQFTFELDLFELSSVTVVGTFDELNSARSLKTFVYSIITMEANNDSLVAMAMTRPKDVFDPWNLPDSFTVYNFAPDYVRSFLHPHWQTQKAPHPMMYYFLGLFYLFIGRLFIYFNT